MVNYQNHPFQDTNLFINSSPSQLPADITFYIGQAVDLWSSLNAGSENSDEYVYHKSDKVCYESKYSLHETEDIAQDLKEINNLQALSISDSNIIQLSLNIGQNAVGEYPFSTSRKNQTSLPPTSKYASPLSEHAWKSYLSMPIWQKSLSTSMRLQSTWEYHALVKEAEVQLLFKDAQ
jgi:hypothetical protein